MGTLISIAGNKDKLALHSQTIKTALKKAGKRVFVINQAWRPKAVASPYVASIFDTDRRYDQQKTISQKLKNYDYVIVEGYTSQTLLNNLHKFKTAEAQRSYCVWLDSLESVTYGIKRPDIALLVTDKNTARVVQLEKLFPNDFDVCTATVLPQFINNLITPYTSQPSNDSTPHDVIMLQIIQQLAIGHKPIYATKEQTQPVKNPKLQNLLDKHAAINSNSDMPAYWKLATTPLNSTVTSSTSTVTSYHSEALGQLFNSFKQSYGENNSTLDLNITPPNEIALASAIAWQYGAEPDNLSYQDKVRIIETWAMHLGPAATDIMHAKLELTLPWADIYVLLSTLPSATAQIQPPTARLGFVDTSKCPEKAVSAIEDMFDTATQYSLTDNSNDYLLFGHLTRCQISLTTKDIIYVLKHELKGSGALTRAVAHIKDTLEEKFPILTTTISNI